MDAEEHREAARRDALDPVEPLDDINVPERAVHVHRLREPARDRDAELPPVAGFGQARVAHVRLDVEMLVLDPIGMIDVEGQPVEAAPEQGRGVDAAFDVRDRSEEHTSELKSLMRISYAA